MKTPFNPMGIDRKFSCHRGNPSPGFSLVEVLLAAVVGGIMVTTMANMSNLSNRMINQATSKQNAQVSINTQIEELRGDNACKDVASLPAGVTRDFKPVGKGGVTDSKLCVITYTYIDDADPKNNFERTVIMPNLDS